MILLWMVLGLLDGGGEGEAPEPDTGHFARERRRRAFIVAVDDGGGR